MEHGAKAAKAFSKLIKQTAPKDGKPGRNRSLVVGATPKQPVVLVSAKKPTSALAELKAMSAKLGAFTPVAVSQVVFEDNEVHVKVFKPANEMAVKKAVLGYYKLYKVAPPSMKVKLLQPDEWEAVEFEYDPNDPGDAEEQDEAETDEGDDETEEDVDPADETEEDEEEEESDEADEEPAAPAAGQRDLIAAKIVATVDRFKKVAAAVGADPAAAKLLQAAKMKLNEASTSLKAGDLDAAAVALVVTDKAMVQALKTRDLAASASGSAANPAAVAAPAPPAGSAAPAAGGSAVPPPPHGGEHADDDHGARPPPLQSLSGPFTPSPDFPPAPSAAELTARQTVIAAVSQKGGSADDQDVALVMKELEKMPSKLLKIVQDAGIKVTACRDSVTDHIAELKGQPPRGWPPEMTWDTVPGCYMPGSKQIVVATKGHDKGAPGVPAPGDGHGASSLTFHETGHAINATKTPMLALETPFDSARTQDIVNLSAYELQSGNAGSDETFAESCARFYSGYPESPTATPRLHAYWASQ